MSNYVGLHRHTSASFLDGFGRPKQIAERLVELGQSAGACTDHGSIWAHAEFNKELRKRDIKPIFGAELYHSRNMHEWAAGKDGSDQRKVRRRRSEISHQTVLAKTQKGYRNLLQLVTASWAEGYYLAPTIDWDALVRHQEGLVVLSGCVIGQLSKWINAGKPELAHQWADWLRNRIENYYIEIIPCTSLKISQTACLALWQIAKELHIPTVITDDAHFPCASDYPAQDAMLCVQTGSNINDPDRLKLGDIYYHCSFDDIMARARQVLVGVPEAELVAAAERSVQIAETCNVELPVAKGPKFSVSKDETALTVLWDWVQEGKAYRRSLELLPEEGTPEWKVYQDREAYELDIIHHHDFANYFLIVADLARWANGNDYWCIARGSAGGSLICWYLGITQIDPITWDLPVERFIDYSRADMPDIDLDFDTRHRQKAFDYLTEKYGKDRCAHIAALSTYRARQAVRDIGKVYKVPSKILDALIALIPEKGNADEGLKATGFLEELFANHEEIKAILAEYPALKLAARLEGQLRQSTVHAAGFVVDSNPLTETVAIVGKPGGTPVISVDKDFAALQGLLKIDVLSVDMLSIIAETLEMIGKDRDWLYRIRLDDEKTYALLATGANMGIFQLQGSAAGKLLPQVAPQNFNEFAAIFALARPGPLKSGGAQEFIDRKHGRVAPPNYDPRIWDIVKESYGTIIYQEQVMRITHQIGGMEWKDVHAIRKLISKSVGKNAMLPYKEKLIGGAKQKEVPIAQVEHIWAQCEAAGNYIFNAAHAKQYAQVGYWSAYLKTHYPAEYTCVYARYEQDDVRRNRMFQEFRVRGGKFTLLDPNRSEVTFSVLDGNTICGGFANIKGMGEQVAKTLVACQPYKDWGAFFSALPPNVRLPFSHTGIDTPSGLNTDVVLTLAPWFIEVRLSDEEKTKAINFGCRPMAQLPEIVSERLEFSHVRLMGRVTDIVYTDLVADAKKYGKEPPKKGTPTIRASVFLADETGTCELTFSAWKWEKLTRDAMKNLLAGDGEGLGNTWIVDAAISDDRTRLFGDNAICVRVKPITDMPLPAGLKPRARATEEELRQLSAQLRLPEV